MHKNLIIFFIAIALLVGAGSYFFSRDNKNASQSQALGTKNQVELPVNSYQYFWGNGCPHCKNVEDFLASWENKDKFKIDKFETWNDRANAQKLKDVAKFCDIPANQVGVPLLFTPEGKCLTGDVPITDFLKNLKPENNETN